MDPEEADMVSDIAFENLTRIDDIEDEMAIQRELLQRTVYRLDTLEDREGKLILNKKSYKTKKYT